MPGGLPETVRARALARLLERMEHGLSLILGEPSECWDAYALADVLTMAELIGVARGEDVEGWTQDAAWLRAVGDHLGARADAVAEAIRRLRDDPRSHELVYASDPEGWRATFAEALRRLG
ncbi:MAG: hypothetical protein H6722_26530 [Sandaracinus sp.]|nr:hypothetical protein [Sandaracinus sp.]